jgi:signal transduction histidine kinase
LIISPLERFFAENPDLPEKQKSQFKLIHRNAKQLLKLINQLLDLSKLEAGKFTPEISQSDIVEFLEKLTFLSKTWQNKSKLIYICDRAKTVDGFLRCRYFRESRNQFVIKCL